MSTEQGICQRDAAATAAQVANFPNDEGLQAATVSYPRKPNVAAIILYEDRILLSNIFFVFQELPSKSHLHLSTEQIQKVSRHCIPWKLLLFSFEISALSRYLETEKVDVV